MTNTDLKNKIIEIAEKNNLKSVIERMENIDAEKIKINVAFLGEFSSGKSTLINALLKKNLLPTNNAPTTAIITEIKKSEFNKIIVTEEIDGKIFQKEINNIELHDEATKTQFGKKIEIFTNEIDFIDEKIQILDTPGITSINEKHTDITFGYLPYIDVAFILMDGNVGSANNTLFSFLSKYPNEFLSKLYFVLTKIDTLSPNQLKNIKVNLENQLSQLINNPQVFEVSGQTALESALSNNIAEYNGSGIVEIIKIIKNDIPKFKATIEENRISEMLKHETKELKKLLEFKLNSLNLNTDELDYKIKELKSEISNIEIDNNRFKLYYEKIKQETIDKIDKIVKECVLLISVKLSKDQPYEDIVVGMIDDIECQIKIGISQIKELKFDKIGKNISEILKASIESQTMQIKELANLITDVSTFILASVVIPGVFNAVEAAASVGTIAAKKAGKLADEAIKTSEKIAEGVTDTVKNAEQIANGVNKVAKVSKGLQVLKFIGKMVEAINPLEKAKCFILPYIINPKLHSGLSLKINDKLETVFQSIELSLNDLIEIQYLQPMREKKELLNNLRTQLNSQNQNIDNTKKQIKDDIITVTKLIN